MSQNNNAKDELSAVAIVVGFVGAMAMFMMIFAFAVLAFVALALTVVCLFAWNSPVTLGKWTLMPDEARGFVYRGLIGSVLLAAFAVFIAILFNIRIEDTAVPYILLGGYTLGSIGLEIMMAQEQSEAPQQTIIPPSQQIAPPPREPSPPAQPFRFASWDDEDGQ
jgi:hypothetical protein